MSRADRCLHHSLAHLRCDRPSRRCKITRSSSRTRNRTMQLTYLEAIRQGIWEEMEKDPTVFCIGEYIGIYGWAFKVTDGFIDRFGPERVIDTPIAESAIVGAAFGAALTGMRPVAEFQFMDFIGCAFNQIVNMVAKAHYRWGAPAPLVIRGPSGGNVHGGPFHSQNPEMWFVHAPGLKVVCPAGAYDAKGLIKGPFATIIRFFSSNINTFIAASRKKFPLTITLCRSRKRGSRGKDVISASLRMLRWCTPPWTRLNSCARRGSMSRFLICGPSRRSTVKPSCKPYARQIRSSFFTSTSVLAALLARLSQSSMKRHLTI